MFMNYICLSNDIFNWNSYCTGGTRLEENLWKRSYEIWNRACYLIESNESEFDLIDGIANLKRSLNHREKLIEENYHFKNISFSNKPKGYLELLESFGIVRPFIMKNLLQIRNDIEHKDTKPPELNRCKELLDATWYFLKSTDNIVNMKKENFEFNFFDNEGNETQYWFEIQLDFNCNTNFKLHGCFPKDMISYNEKDNFFNIEVIKFCEYNKNEHLNLHKNNLSTDKFINGVVDLNSDFNCKRFYKKVINTY